MAVGLENISLIVPIENIEQYYPGGFEKYKSDNKESIGGRIWYDDYLVRDGAMSNYDVGRLIGEWESYGLKGVIEVNGAKQWKDLCVVDYFGGATLPCVWLKSRDSSVSHINDDSKLVIHRNNLWDGKVSLFKPIEWLKQFKEASAAHDRLELRKLRKEIFQQTIQIIKQKEYSLEGENIQLDNSKITEETVFYTKPKHLTPSKSDAQTKFAVIEADCIETSHLLNKTGYNVCMLNMANRQNPGGAVSSGAGAQEENVFRRSNILLSLYQFVDYSNQYRIEKHKEHSYPLDRETGGVYTKNATIFRGSENNGYCLLKNPFELSIVSVPAINGPKIDLINRFYRITKDLVGPSKEKIRTILRICGENNHDCLVLSAFGCGAFRNPPQHMAELFKEVFEEPEFINQFKLVVFSIIDDHNSWGEHNPEGNVIPFARVFERSD